MMIDCRCLDGFSTVIAGLVDPQGHGAAARVV
jgi:hypothetical protein